MMSEHLHTSCGLSSITSNMCVSALFPAGRLCKRTLPPPRLSNVCPALVPRSASFWGWGAEVDAPRQYDWGQYDWGRQGYRRPLGKKIDLCLFLFQIVFLLGPLIVLHVLHAVRGGKYSASVSPWWWWRAHCGVTPSSVPASWGSGRRKDTCAPARASSHCWQVFLSFVWREQMGTPV